MELASKLAEADLETVMRPCIMHLHDGTTIQLVSGEPRPVSVSEALR